MGISIVTEGPVGLHSRDTRTILPCATHTQGRRVFRSGAPGGGKSQVNSSARHVTQTSRYISIVGKTGGPPTPKPTPPLEGHWESRLILARGHAHVRSIKGAMPLSARQKATAAAAYVTSRLSTCGGETASAIVAAPRHSAAASRNVESSKVSS